LHHELQTLGKLCLAVGKDGWTCASGLLDHKTAIAVENQPVSRPLERCSFDVISSAVCPGSVVNASGWACASLWGNVIK